MKNGDIMQRRLGSAFTIVGAILTCSALIAMNTNTAVWFHWQLFIGLALIAAGSFLYVIDARKRAKGTRLR